MALKHRDIVGLLGRFGDTEQEFSVTWSPLTTLKSPTSIKTDRVVSFLVLHWRGRIGVTVAAFTPVPDAIRYLLQEIRVYGTHAQFGAQIPFRIRAKTQSDMNKIYRIGYGNVPTQNTGTGIGPRDKILKGGVAGTFDGTVANFDIDMFVTIPLFPLPMALNVAPLYSLKGPDWAGNLFVDVDTGDATGLGTLGTSVVAFSAYGVATGSPTLFVHVVRPLLTVDLMNAISPAIPFRSYKTLDSVVQGANLTLSKITDLNIGKRMVALHIQTGVLQTGVSGGVRSYASFSDGVITRTVIGLDGKFLALPFDGLSQQELDSWLGGQSLQQGYSVYSFMRETGNPDSVFPSETLTAARRFELDGDVTGAANQGTELVQDEILGQPQLIGA